MKSKKKINRKINKNNSKNNNKNIKYSNNNKTTNIKPIKHKKTIKKTIKNKMLFNIKGGSMKTCACVNYDVINNHYSLQNNPTAKSCQNKPADGSEFCQKHQKCPNFMKTYVNGYEHNYNPKQWNHPYVEGSHNCYTYFLNNQIKAIKDRCDELCKKHGSGCPKKIEQCGNLKPQPGHYNNLLKKGNLDIQNIIIKGLWLLIQDIHIIFIDKMLMEHGVINLELYL